MTVKTKKLYNLNILSEMADGNEEFIGEMIDYFIDKASHISEEFELNYQQKDYKNLRSAAHKFLSNVNMLGISTLSEYVDQIESIALTQENLEKLPLLIASVKQICNDVVDELKTDFKNK